MASDPIVAVLVDLVRIGIRIELEHGELRITPRNALTTDLRGRIKRHRDELVRIFENKPFLSGGTDRADGRPHLSVSSVPPDRNTRNSHGLYSACPTCGGPEFIFLDDAEEWVCARCRPAPAEARIIGRWTTVEAAAAKRAVTPAMFGAEKEWTDEG